MPDISQNQLKTAVVDYWIQQALNRQDRERRKIDPKAKPRTLADINKNLAVANKLLDAGGNPNPTPPVNPFGGYGGDSSDEEQQQKDKEIREHPK